MATPIRQVRKTKLVLVIPGFGMLGQDFKSIPQFTFGGFDWVFKPIGVLPKESVTEQAKALDSMLLQACSELTPDAIVGFSMGGDLLMELALQKESFVHTLPRTTTVLLLDPNVRGSADAGDVGTCFITNAAAEASNFDAFYQVVKKRLIPATSKTSRTPQWHVYLGWILAVKHLFPTMQKLGRDVRHTATKRYFRLLSTEWARQARLQGGAELRIVLSPSDFHDASLKQYQEKVAPFGNLLTVSTIFDHFSFWNHAVMAKLLLEVGNSAIAGTIAVAAIERAARH